MLYDPLTIQMLLDTYTVKSGLSSLLPSPAPAGFVKRVNASFSKIETLLKTLQVQPSPPEALVQAYLIHIADRSNTNFRKVLDLKGIRSRQEQNHLVELFQVHRASDRHAPNLQQNNPILGGALPNPPPSTSGSASQGLLSTSAAASSSSRFDPSMLGSAIISAAKDGVDRFGNPSFTAGSGSTGGSGGGGGAPAISVSGTSSPGPGPSGPPPAQPQPHAHGGGSGGESTPSGNLNENLKNIGKFFRRDLGGFGGRFGRGAEDGSG